jgi:transposase
MQTLMTQDAELARLRAENARLAAALQQEQDARVRIEQLALQLGKDKEKLEKELAALDHKYQQLRQRLFGRSSEKIDQEELERALKEEEAREQAEAAANATPPHAAEAPDGETPTLPPEQPTKKEKKGHGRRRRPKIVPRERRVHEPSPAELVCACCGGQKKSISSDEVTERYEYRPASLLLVEHVRPRFRCAKCQDGTTMAPLPPAPIDRGLAEAGLLAYVAASKFGDHLPLNRIKKILLREGVDFPRSTLCDWVDQTAGLVEPIADEIRCQILQHVVVGMDETGILIVFDKNDKENGTRRGKIWAYRGRKGEVYFAISETKSHDDENGPQVVLRLRRGFVQADADGTFDILFEDGSRLEVGCNAHARRKFVQAKKSHPKEVAFVLTAFRRVYEIEARIREVTPEERKAVRQAESKPILDVLDAYLDALAPTLVPGTPMAIAVNYSRKHRVALRRFLDHGDLEADNNAVERALRLVAVGRRNWLFAGSENSAKNAAILYTLVGSCKDLGIDPWEYLRDVIERVTTHPASRIAELVPRAWLEARKAKESAATATS